MLNKRSSVFETNSSSSHSLSVNESVITIDTNYTIDEAGYLVIEADEFGWDYKVITKAGKKLSYVYLYIKDWVKNKEEKIFFAAMLFNVCMKQTNCVGLKLSPYPQKSYRSGMDMGYIDHQSVDERDLDWLFKDENYLHNFIFNKNSTLITDNDNH